MIPAIEAVGLTKIYRTKGRQDIALDRASLTTNPGEVVAILGLNGAGKSTLTKVLLDLIRPTSGKASIFGSNVRSRQWKHLVGYLPESFRSPRGFTAQSLLRYLGRLS